MFRLILFSISAFFVGSLISSAYETMDPIYWRIGVVCLVGLLLFRLFEIILSHMNNFVTMNVVRWALQYIKLKTGEQFSHEDFKEFVDKRLDERFGVMREVCEKDINIHKAIDEDLKNKNG